MSDILYVQASPRKNRSKSITVADAFIQTYRQNHPDDKVRQLDLFAADLPTFDGLAVEAKYNILHQQSFTPSQKQAWQAIESVIEDFKSADIYVFALGMWNFSIPYRLKQYIDILVQPGYTFGFDPATGYSGLLTGKSAVIVFARGGEYSSEQTSTMDFQKPYLEFILGFMGITDIHSLVVEPTLAGAEDQKQNALDAALTHAGQLAQSL